MNAGFEELKNSTRYVYGDVNIALLANGEDGVELSIVMPTKDVSVYLSDLLTNMYNNLISANIQFEVFAVDDGSADGTLQILRKFAADHPSNF